MPEDYRPSKALIDKFREYIDSMDPKKRDEERLYLGKQVFTWHNVIKEIEEGTEFGIRYARAFEAVLNRE